MKNRINPGTYLLCFFVCFCNWSCNNEKKDMPNEPNTPIEVSAPSNIISLDEANSIYDNYTKHRIALIETYESQEREPSESFEAARFVDFDYQMIKDYIAFIDQESAKAGVKEVTKLRMYFANYPNENKFPDGKSVVHKRQNSIFLTPTLAVNGGNYSFYIGDDGKAKLIIDQKIQSEKGIGSVSDNEETAHASLIPNFFKTTSMYSGQSLILNRGNNGPPPKTDF
jgi:hypothetical protein